MPSSKKVEEDKVPIPVKEPAKLSSSLQMKRLEKNNQEIIKSKGVPPPGDQKPPVHISQLPISIQS